MNVRRDDRSAAQTANNGGLMSRNAVAPERITERDTSDTSTSQVDSIEQNGTSRKKRDKTTVGLTIHPKIVKQYKKIAIDERTSFSEIAENLLIADLKDRGIDLDLSTS